MFVRRDVAAPWGFARAWQRLDHARYLETLGELLDIQMGPRPRPALEPPAPPALPIDASTGRPPVYTRAGTGFRLRADALDWGVPR